MSFPFLYLNHRLYVKDGYSHSNYTHNTLQTCQSQGCPSSYPLVIYFAPNGIKIYKKNIFWGKILVTSDQDRKGSRNFLTKVSAKYGNSPLDFFFIQLDVFLIFIFSCFIFLFIWTSCPLQVSRGTAGFSFLNL